MKRSNQRQDSARHAGREGDLLLGTAAGLTNTKGKDVMDYSEFKRLPELSDEEFLAERARVRPFTACILKKGPKFEAPGPDHTAGVTKIIWQHGKRNTGLHKAGLLPIVCPISDSSELAGLSIFDATIEDVDAIMSDDPAVVAGVLTYELHPTRSYAGSALK